MSEEINENQFVTLDDVKNQFGFTSTQSDNKLLFIVQSANDEVKKRIITVVDDITQIENSKFFPKCLDTAMTFCEAEIKRQINHLYDEYEKIMKSFESKMESLLGDLRAIAPKRTSLQVVSRDVPFEDDYFAERHMP